MKTLALLPLRGGSKSIPRKNLKPIAGKPLFHWSALAACEASCIDEVHIATDDEAIADSARALGHPKIRIFKRSAASATDTALTESVMLEFAEQVAFERLVLIQATSPLLTAHELDAGMAKFERVHADSLLSVVRQERFFWKESANGLAEAVNYDPLHRPRRQDFEGQLVENGAFYICSRDGLQRTRCRIHGKIALFEMAPETYYELDEPSDWEIVERLILGKAEKLKGGKAERDDSCLSTTPQDFSVSAPQNFSISAFQHSSLSPELLSRARAIRLVLTDVDGVLTDAGMYYSETGDELKKFNTRDGMGFQLLREAGIRTGIITSEDTEMVARRAKKLKVDFLYQGVKDKSAVLDEILARTGLSAEEVAYIGDDLNDLKLHERVGLAFCPTDAIDSVKRIVHKVVPLTGGNGCLRWMGDFLLEHKNIKK